MGFHGFLFWVKACLGRCHQQGVLQHPQHSYILRFLFIRAAATAGFQLASSVSLSSVSFLFSPLSSRHQQHVRERHAAELTASFVCDVRALNPPQAHTRSSLASAPADPRADLRTDLGAASAELADGGFSC